ncbi:hypothetical protein N657DRAFT_453928 [Parathielavia appendiculata]|uniref:Uncharacterized protein n=1 Tax=Parathielavia appendiculata TaxID=2587402 RepID=A0AAN6TZ15_9PEZI|nr:hypothetical protein N657DRAFT_453928 [Parathielavia appendiculata]
MPFSTLGFEKLKCEVDLNFTARMIRGSLSCSNTSCFLRSGEQGRRVEHSLTTGVGVISVGGCTWEVASKSTERYRASRKTALADLISFSGDLVLTQQQDTAEATSRPQDFDDRFIGPAQLLKRPFEVEMRNCREKLVSLLGRRSELVGGTDGPLPHSSFPITVAATGSTGKVTWAREIRHLFSKGWGSETYVYLASCVLRLDQVIYAFIDIGAWMTPERELGFTPG